MNAGTGLKEYVEIPIRELVESSTNPRKSFDEAALDELAGSIRSNGVLSPCGKVRTWSEHNPPP
jgi:ParB family transcriptional regulator, chromosome partitioning protein